MIKGKQLRDAFLSGAHAIHNHRQEVDELNVFPVPDGDTGTNMSMTIGNAVNDLTAMPDDCTVEQVASTAASALLRGARGNSGVILSLLFRGFQRAMRGKDEASSADFIAAFNKGVEYAYKAVMKPTEGTILTVARVAAERVSGSADLEPAALWKSYVAAAEETLATTPDLLPVLKKAGVVDSGGKGYCVIAGAICDCLKTGRVLPLEGAEAAEAPKPAEDGIDPRLAGLYCTEFTVLKGKNASHPRLRAYLESIGESVVCTDEAEQIKCHLHTEHPGKALTEAVRHGRLTDVKVENLAEQFAARKAEAEAAGNGSGNGKDAFPYVAPGTDEKYAFVAVAAGEGVRSVFADLGVQRIVSGGQTMNPSAEDIVNAVQSLSAENILILANNKNIVLSAAQAVKLADRKAVVVPTRTIPQGIGAMLAFDETLPLEDNLRNMEEARGRIVTGEITYASRTAEFDGQHITEGETLALVDGKLAFGGGEPDEAAQKLIVQLCGNDTAFVTVIYGEGVPEERAQRLLDAAKAHISPDIETSLICGGMPVYTYYISVES